MPLPGHARSVWNGEGQVRIPEASLLSTLFGAFLGVLRGGGASQVTLVVKNPPANAGDMRQVPFLGQEDSIEEGMATFSSILAWKIPWTEEPGELQSTGSHRVGHD